MKQNLHVDSRYVYLQETNGHGVGVTCNTLGYHSILTRSECIDAAEEINLTQGYGAYHTELDCNDVNPNHCFTNTAQKKIFFTRVDCPVHQGSTRPSIGMICRKDGML